MWMKMHQNQATFFFFFFCYTPSPGDRLTEVRAKLRVSSIPCPRNSRANAIIYAGGRSVNKRRGPRVRRRRGPRDHTGSRGDGGGGIHHRLSLPLYLAATSVWGVAAGGGRGGASTHGKSTVNRKQLLIALQLFNPHHKPGD